MFLDRFFNFFYLDESMEWDNQTKALSSQDMHKETLLSKGNILYSQGKHTEALTCYDEALKLDPRYKEALNNKGYVLKSRGEYGKAVVCYDEALAIDPGYKDKIVLNSKGIILCYQGEYGKAVDCYDKALAIDRSYKAAWYNKGNALCSEGKYNDAIKCYEEALEIDSKFQEAWHNKGRALYSQGRYEQALPCYEAALLLGKKLEQVWRSKGDAQRHLGKYQEAVDCYTQALRLDPKFKEVWCNKGRALCSQGEYTEALTCFDKAIALDSKYKEAWNYKGVTLKSQGQDAEALTCYNQALVLDPHYKEAWHNKSDIYASKIRDAAKWNNGGLALASQQKHAEALICYNKALTLNPKYKEAWDNKGYVLRSQGKYSEALYCFSRAFVLTPNYEETSIFDAALKLNPYNKEALNTKGYIFDLQGKYLEAIACFEKVLAIDSTYVPAQQNLERTISKYIQQNPETFFTTHFRGFIKLNPKIIATIPGLFASAINRRRFEEAYYLVLIGTNIENCQDLLMENLSRLKQTPHSRKWIIKLFTLMIYLGKMDSENLVQNNTPIDIREEIRQGRDEILENHGHFIKKHESVLANHIYPHISSITLDKRYHKKAFEELLTLPELQPLLEIVRFAVLGLHKLGRTNDRNISLRIIVDTENDNIEDVTCGSTRNAYGAYYNDENTLYLAGKRADDSEESRFLARGTFIHEVTHFIANEVFQNDCNPYAKGNQAAENEFTKITNNLATRKDNLSEKLERIKAVFNYPKSKWNLELIVRVPQIIAMYRGSEGRELLEKECPELLKYYLNVFLPACQKHVLELYIDNGIPLPGVRRITDTRGIIEAAREDVRNVGSNSSVFTFFRTVLGLPQNIPQQQAQIRLVQV